MKSTTRIARKLVQALALAVGLASISHAEPPSQIGPNLTTYVGTGGDSVSGAGEWSIIADGDSQKCDLFFYRLDYQSMTWGNGTAAGVGVPFQVVDSGNTALCQNSAFGTSSSLVGNTLVVGAPLYDGGQGAGCASRLDGGAILIFAFNGSEWTRRQIGSQQSCGQGTILRPDDGTALDRFGFSVSLSPNPLSPNDFLVAVGAPSKGVVIGEEGRVYAFQFNVVTNEFSLTGTYSGEQGGENLGFSVTTSYPNVLVGAPFYDNLGELDAGRAVLLDGLSGLDPLIAQSGEAEGESLGREVSLSNELLLASSEVKVGVRGGPEPSYAGPAGFIPPFNGDVSQSAGVSAFGRIGEGVTIARNVLEDYDLSDGSEIYAPVFVPVTGAGLDIGYDIRLVDEYLWFADRINDRGILVTYPCSYGRKLTALQWDIVSIPCSIPGNATVASVFGASLYDGGNGMVYGVDYEVWAIDPIIADQPRPYRRLNAADTVNQSDAYWLITAYDQYFSIPSTVSVAFTTSAAPSLGQAANVRRVRAAVMPTAPGLNPIQWMVGNPFTREFYWADLWYQPPVGTGGNLALAETNGHLDSTIYVYRPDDMGGQEYVAFDGAPGFDGPVLPYEGFFIKVNPAGALSNLQLPLTE